MPGPMEGIKVVEMGVWVAGPSAAVILCGWGADVIKIEPPTGDPFRGLFASALGAAIPVNPPFEIDNRGKRSVCLNLDNEGGRAIARRLLDEADVFISNMRPRVVERAPPDQRGRRQRDGDGDLARRAAGEDQPQEPAEEGEARDAGGDGGEADQHRPDDPAADSRRERPQPTVEVHVAMLADPPGRVKVA